MSAEPVTGPPTDADLAATEAFDHDDATVAAWARDVTRDAEDPADRAKRLFADVRDRVRYDPHDLDPARESFRASAVLASPANWCVPKAILLTAGARAAGIPARIGFADVRNHLSPEELRGRMGTDLFVYPGYAAPPRGDRSP